MKKVHVQLCASVPSLLLYLFVLTTCLFSLFILVNTASAANDAEISLAWDKNTETDLLGYKIYYKTDVSGEPYEGTDAYEGASPITVLVEDLPNPDAPSYKLTQLSEGTTYYMVVTALNRDEAESDYSNEVSVTTSVEIINETPTANAGMDQLTTEGNLVYLNGVNSSDPEDSIAEYQWQQISGPSVSLTHSSFVEASFTAPNVGPDGASLTFELTVTDQEGLSDTDTCIVNIVWLNEAPVADAGADQTVTEGETVTLSGQGSTDSDDAVLSYQWTQTEGPLVNLNGANTAQPYFTAPDVSADGESLTFKLLVEDNGGLIASDYCVVNISWLNEAPTANAGEDTTASPGETVMLDGLNSFDPEGDIVSYTWTQTSGRLVALTTPTMATTTFMVPDTLIEGDTLSFELTVKDSGGLQASDVCSVEIPVIVSEQVEDNTNNNGNNNNSEETPVTVAAVTESDDDATDAVLPDEEADNGEAIANNGSESDDGTTDMVSPDQEESPNTTNNRGGRNNATNSNNLIENAVLPDEEADNGQAAVTPNNEPQASNAGNDATVSDDGQASTTNGDGNSTTNNIDLVESDAAVDEETDAEEEIVQENQPNVTEVSENESPYQPEIVSPQNGALVSTTQLRLETGAFMDPDVNDTHHKTQWQVYQKNSGVCVVNIVSVSFLTAILVPEMVLDEETNYYWRARFIDNQNNASDWSSSAYFVTSFSGNDSDGNGVPDSQEADITVDLNGDLIPDVEQSHIRSISLPNSENHIGLSIEGSPTVTSILSMAALDPQNTSTEMDQETEVLPYGLINFKVSVANPGDKATVTIFFDAPAPKGAKWVKYNTIQDMWIDYSPHATFAEDRMSVVLTFKDGGFGDDDGIKNGIIVDPSGLEIESAQSTTLSETTNSVVSEGGGGGGGCFIAASTEGETGDAMLMLSIGLFLSLAIVRFLRVGNRR